MNFMIKAPHVTGSFCLWVDILLREGEKTPSRSQRPVLPRTEARVPGSFGSVLGRTDLDTDFVSHRISRNIIPTLALILLFPHTEISTRRYTLNEFKIISHRIHRIHRELLGKELKESEQ